MLPEYLYMTDLGKMAYAVLYLPLVLVLLWLVFWKFKLPKLMLVVLAPVLLTLPFWDVYMIGRDSERLCREEGGLHVYKVVEAEGFLGGGSAERWLGYGFNFIESGDGTKMSRYTMENGKVLHHRIQQFISLYSVETGDNHKVITKSISRSTERIVDLENGQVLGELITFNIHPGRFDGIFLKSTGSGPVVWHCGNAPPDGSGDGLGYGDVVKAVLKPKQPVGVGGEN